MPNLVVALCVKYARKNIFTDPYFSLYEHRFCPYIWEHVSANEI